MKAYVHNQTEIAAARAAGQPIGLQFRSGAATVLHPNGQQVRASRKIEGKSARKHAKRTARALRERIASLDPVERTELHNLLSTHATPAAQALAAQCMKGGTR